jgi:hypothetical protein
VHPTTAGHELIGARAFETQSRPMSDTAGGAASALSN